MCLIEMRHVFRHSILGFTRVYLAVWWSVLKDDAFFVLRCWSIRSWFKSFDIALKESYSLDLERLVLNRDEVLLELDAKRQKGL